jgi:carboxyl-terminal processing protease
MPDYFVPLDTSLNSHYLNELYTSTSIQEFTFNYAERNKERLEDNGFDNYLRNFNVTDDMLEELVRVGQRNGVKRDSKELREKKRLFLIHMKAQIARKIWGNDGLYPIMNETNEIFLQSLKLFNRIPDLNRSDM